MIKNFREADLNSKIYSSRVSLFQCPDLIFNLRILSCYYFAGLQFDVYEKDKQIWQRYVQKYFSISAPLLYLQCFFQLRYCACSVSFSSFTAFQCSTVDVSDKLRKEITDVPAVHITKPKATEFQVDNELTYMYLCGLIACLPAFRYLALAR